MKVWKRVKLGTGIKDGIEFLATLKTRGIKVDVITESILKKSALVIATESVTVDLVVVTPGDLGFTEFATLPIIYAAAKKLSLSLCPAEVGPQLALQYTDQPVGEDLIIGMEPLDPQVTNAGLFTVKRSSVGRHLINCFSGRNYRWALSNHFVFMLGESGKMD